MVASSAGQCDGVEESEEDREEKRVCRFSSQRVNLATRVLNAPSTREKYVGDSSDSDNAQDTVTLLSPSAIREKRILRSFLPFILFPLPSLPLLPFVHCQNQCQPSAVFFLQQLPTDRNSCIRDGNDIFCTSSKVKHPLYDSFRCCKMSLLSSKRKERERRKRGRRERKSA